MVSNHYDNIHWEYHLPINPPISEEDIDITGQKYVYPWLVDSNDLANWDFGTHVGYRSRMKRGVHDKPKPKELREEDWDDALDKDSNE